MMGNPLTGGYSDPLQQLQAQVIALSQQVAALTQARGAAGAVPPAPAAGAVPQGQIPLPGAAGAIPQAGAVGAVPQGQIPLPGAAGAVPPTGAQPDIQAQLAALSQQIAGLVQGQQMQAQAAMQLDPRAGAGVAGASGPVFMQQQAEELRSDFHRSSMSPMDYEIERANQVQSQVPGQGQTVIPLYPGTGAIAQAAPPAAGAVPPGVVTPPIA